MADHFVVVTASGGVSSDVVAALCNSLSAQHLKPGAPRRLAPGAVEIPVDLVAPLNRAGLLSGPYDVNVVPAENRQKSILIADMDSTIISVECIDELADFAGVKTEVALITERAMQGELDFEGSLLARVALLAGLPLAALEQCYRDRVHLNPGAAELVERMNGAGALTALVSGGFTYFTERVAKRAGFQCNRANTLIDDGTKLIGTVRMPILGQQAKREALEGFVASRGTTMRDVIAVGDGANDLAMVRAAGLGVAYHAKPALVAEADAILNYSDLTALLALQGLSH